MTEQGQPDVERLDMRKDVRVDYFKDINEFAKSEIAWVKSAYKFAASLVALIAVVGIAFTYKSTSDFKKEIQEEIERQKSQLEIRMGNLGKGVELRVEEEFKTENIQKIVEEKAKLRLDEIADSLIAKQISGKIAPQIDSAEKKLQKIQDDLETSTKRIEELTAISEFTMTAIAAQNDDRIAFDKLKSWAMDSSFSRHQEAAKAWLRIMDEHTSPFEESGFNVPWKEGIEPTKLSLDDIKKSFNSTPAHVRLGLLEFVWTRQDIPKKDKMVFLVDVLKNDNSLKVVEYAGRYFLKESKQKLKPLAINEHLDWWEKNQNSFDNN